MRPLVSNYYLSTFALTTKASKSWISAEIPFVILKLTLPFK